VKELLRPKLVERLERLKVENATRIVAAVLRHQQPDKANLPEHQGQSISLPTIEPAVDPVDGDQLLTDLAATFEKYVFLPKHASTALALAVVMAHTHDIQTISPMIAVVSPEPECGKTTLLLVGKAVMPRALLNADITKATLFRMIEKYHPSLLVDEADSIFKDNDDLRSVFNASHVRKSAVVPRTVGDHHEPQLFSTWCPKWLALIGKLPPTLEGRSIIIRMRRRTWKDQVERLRQDRIDDELYPLARQAARWAKDHLNQLKNADPSLPEDLGDRARDNWRPLVAIADAAGGDWPRKARAAALALSRRSTDDESDGIMLLADLQKVFRPDASGKPVKSLPTVAILRRLTSPDMEDRPWSEYRYGREPITAHQLSRLLRPFGVHHRKVRFADGTAWCYQYDDLKEAFRRYVPGPPSPNWNTGTQRINTGDSRARKWNGVPDSGETKGAKTQPCSSVPDPEGGQGALFRVKRRVRRWRRPATRSAA